MKTVIRMIRVPENTLATGLAGLVHVVRYTFPEPHDEGYSQETASWDWKSEIMTDRGEWHEIADYMTFDNLPGGVQPARFAPTASDRWTTPEVSSG